MRPVLVPAFLRTLRLLLPLAACGWAPVVASPIWSNPDELVHLYTSSPSRSFHLQMYADGRVEGTPFETVNSAVVLKTDHRDCLNIIGVKSGLFLCMHNNGKLYGSRYFSNDCVFKYHGLTNNHDAYESIRHNLLISLGNVKGPFVPNGDLPPFSQFLVRKNKIPLSKFNS